MTQISLFQTNNNVGSSGYHKNSEKKNKKFSGGGLGSKFETVSVFVDLSLRLRGVIEYMIRYSISIVRLTNQFVFDRIYYQNI